GTFTQSGGTHTVNGTLAVGNLSGPLGRDVYSMSGGTIAAQFLAVSETGSFVQTGGSTSVSNGLSIGGHGVVKIGGGTFRTGALQSVSANAKLDLTDQSMVVDYAASSPAIYVRDMTHAGFAGGSWTGAGIGSSAAAVDG